MTRKELIERLINVAENYKKGYLSGNGALTDIGVLVDEYAETNGVIYEEKGKIGSKCESDDLEVKY